jgi:hypothetical protein
MSNAGKKTTVKDGFVAPQIKLEEEQKGAAVSVKQQIEAPATESRSYAKRSSGLPGLSQPESASAACAARCPGARAAIQVQSP